MESESEMVKKSNKKTCIEWSLKESKDNFYTSCFFVIILPLLPLYLEFLSTNQVSTTSWALASSFFALTSATASKFKSFFAVYIVVGFSFSSILYFHQGKEDYIKLLSICILLYICICNLIERYIRHVKEEPNEEYFTFFHGKEYLKKKRDFYTEKINELKDKLEKLHKSKELLEKEIDIKKRLKELDMKMQKDEKVKNEIEELKKSLRDTHNNMNLLNINEIIRDDIAIPSIEKKIHEIETEISILYKKIDELK